MAGPESEPRLSKDEILKKLRAPKTEESISITDQHGNELPTLQSLTALRAARVRPRYYKGVVRTPVEVSPVFVGKLREILAIGRIGHTINNGIRVTALTPVAPTEDEPDYPTDPAEIYERIDAAGDPDKN